MVVDGLNRGGSELVMRCIGVCAAPPFLIAFPCDALVPPLPILQEFLQQYLAACEQCEDELERLKAEGVREHAALKRRQAWMVLLLGCWALWTESTNAQHLPAIAVRMLRQLPFPLSMQAGG